MVIMVSERDKPHIAKLAFKWSFSCVSSSMDEHVVSLREVLLTDLTLVP